MSQITEQQDNPLMSGSAPEQSGDNHENAGKWAITVEHHPEYSGGKPKKKKGKPKKKKGKPKKKSDR